MQRTAATTTTSFSVATWNVLADCYARPKSFPYCPSQYLKWSTRKDKVMQNIRKLDSDILCLQEVDHHKFYIRQLKDLAYDTAFVLRGNGVAGSKHDGCLIAWRRRMFEQVPESHLTVDFNDLARNALDRGDRMESMRLMRHNVGQTILLRRRDVPSGMASPLVLIANCHLFWNPQFEDVKLKQAEYMMEHIQSTLRSELVSNALVTLSPHEAAKVPGFVHPGHTSAYVLRASPHSASQASKIIKKSQKRRAARRRAKEAKPQATQLQLLRDNAPEQGLEIVDQTKDDLSAEVGTEEQPQPQRQRQQQQKQQKQPFDVSSASDGMPVEDAPADGPSAVPVVLCGDLNSLPTSLAYRYLATGHCRVEPAHGADGPRLLLDFDLYKLARWLRVLGINAAYVKEEECPNGVKSLYRIAREECRVFVTRSKQAAMAKGCQQSFVLKASPEKEDALEDILDHFSYRFPPRKDASKPAPQQIEDAASSPTEGKREGGSVNVLEVAVAKLSVGEDESQETPFLFVARCIICNSELQRICTDNRDNLHGLRLKDVPDDIVETVRDRHGRRLEIHQCTGCKQAFWWPVGSDLAAERFANIRQIADKARMLANKQVKSQDYDGSSAENGQGSGGSEGEKQQGRQGGGRTTFSYEPQDYDHNLDFRSVYCRDGQEPEFTNYTKGFKGCLDYIFYSLHSDDVEEDVVETKKLLEDDFPALSSSSGSSQRSADQHSSPDQKSHTVVNAWMRPVERTKLPSKGQVSKHTALPSQSFPSDHLPLRCVFNLKWKTLPSAEPKAE